MNVEREIMELPDEARQAMARYVLRGYTFHQIDDYLYQMETWWWVQHGQRVVMRRETLLALLTSLEYQERTNPHQRAAGAY